MQLEEMIALNFTLFTDQEYARIPPAIANVSNSITTLKERPKPTDTRESNTIFHVIREAPPVCESILEEVAKRDICT